MNDTISREATIKMLEKMYDDKYDPRPCNRTDDGGMYNDSELDVILEIIEKIKKL
jgi:hypothetical protein